MTNLKLFKDASFVFLHSSGTNPFRNSACQLILILDNYIFVISNLLIYSHSLVIFKRQKRGVRKADL